MSNDDRIKVVQRVLIGADQSFEMGNEGYMVSRGENVVAFYLDARTKTGRAYPLTTCSSVYFPEKHSCLNYPSIMLEDGEDPETTCEIHFPEFEGWNVHSVDGGKTMAICLVKREPL